MTIDTCDFKGKKVIVRVDFNVPLDENGNITDDTRIRGALPTLKKVLAEGGALIIMSHMGRPKKNPDPKFSLRQIVPAVSEKLGVPVQFCDDCQKAQAQGVTALAGLVNQMLPDIATSLSNTEILSLAAGIANYEIVESIGFPYDQTTADIEAGDCVIPINLAANVSKLHDDLFGTQGYTPSETVQQISNQIISDTGIQ